MRRTLGRVVAAAAIAVAVPLGFAATTGTRLFAADHLDPPARTDPDVDATPDVAADIADVYTWYTATDVVIALTFAGPRGFNLPPVYDRDVLYTINISNERLPVAPTYAIRIRFGNDGASWGVQFEGVPGVNGTITGPVETKLQKDGVIAQAGLFDDPFFFDLQGFRATRSTGTLSFNNQRNFFRGQNDTAVVIQIPKSRLANGSNPIRVWADTGRIGGQI